MCTHYNIIRKHTNPYNHSYPYMKRHGVKIGILLLQSINNQLIKFIYFMNKLS